MSVQFEEPQFHYRTIDISGAVTHNTPYLVRWRLVKDLKAANTVMLTIVAVCIVASFIIASYKPASEKKTYKEDYTAEELTHMLPETVNNLPTKTK